MQKKIFLQILLLLSIFLISIIFFKFYYKSNAVLNKSSSKIEKNEQIDGNLMSNIKYIAADKMGNEYKIFSKFAEFDKNEPNLISMTQVEGVLKFTNSAPITIIADNAIYNKLNHDTNFFENVVINYDEHQISSHNLDLFFEKNFASVSKNIIYKSLNTELRADKIEIDLITKNSKIFMNEKSKKIKIITLK